MRILHINDTYAMTGGIARYLFEVMDLLEQAGHENVVVYQQEHQRTITDHRPAHHIPALGTNSSSNAVQDVIEEYRPDVVFLHAVYDPMLVKAVVDRLPTMAYIHGFHTVCPGLAKYFRRVDAVCTRPYGLGCIPMIYGRRCSNARHPRTVYRLMRTTAEQQQIYQSVSLLLVASQYMRDLLQQNNFAPEKIAVLPYPHTPAAHIQLIPDKPLRLFYAGRLEIEKGIPYLLRAFTRLATPCTLHIAGDGTLRATYEQMAQELGIASRVKFLGWLNDEELDKEYQAARAIIMPSIFPEPFGQVGVQAMLRERPVIAFDVGGISDWLKDGEHGFLVPSRNVETLVRRIELLLNDKPLAIKLGAQGKAFAFKAYKPETHTQALINLISGVIGTS